MRHDILLDIQQWTCCAVRRRRKTKTSSAQWCTHSNHPGWCSDGSSCSSDMQKSKISPNSHQRRSFSDEKTPKKNFNFSFNFNSYYWLNPFFSFKFRAFSRILGGIWQRSSCGLSRRIARPWGRRYTLTRAWRSTERRDPLGSGCPVQLETKCKILYHFSLLYP